jgi:hypothetical protein
MSGNDLTIHEYFTYDSKGMNDREQIIASLRCIIPDADELEKQFETLATDRGVTGKAYSGSMLE